VTAGYPGYSSPPMGRERERELGILRGRRCNPAAGPLQNWKVGQQHRSLTLGPSSVLCSEKHNRQLTLVSQRQEHAEIGIRRDECAAFIPGALENLGVCGGLQNRNRAHGPRHTDDVATAPRG
jgi:hypothetical protein